MLLVRSKRAADRNEALEVALKAWARRPGDPRIADTLGWVYLQRKEYKMAAELLEPAALLLPQNTTVAFHLGSLLAATGQPDRAAYYLGMVIARSQDPEEVKQAEALVKALRPVAGVR